MLIIINTDNTKQETINNLHNWLESQQVVYSKLDVDLSKCEMVGVLTRPFKTNTCPTCNGIGKLTVISLAGSDDVVYLQCPKCKGIGRLE
jgi:DnaJ-class molecular chaperone